MQKQRRDFLKITAAGAAGLALTKADRAFAAWPGTGTMPVNPNIDNMRVVACQDSLMSKKPNPTTFANNNAAVDSARVQANMDAMAMALANQTTADAAWKAIFRTGKSSWAATKVAIKVNCIAPQNMASLAVVQKFCNIFAGFGVLPASIIIYDGNTTYGAGISNYNSYFSATDTTKTPGVVSSYNTALGGTTNAAIPGGSSAACSAAIANGTIDILVNIANNKGHTQMGGATLSMKNHYGTFAPKHDNAYCFNINKSDAILGGTPVRQQLVFIDSILANSRTNTGNPDAQPNYLIMGVFGPAVDYLTAKKVREAVMGCTHTAATIDSYMTTFGYATTDPVWVVVPPAGGATGTGGAGGSSGAGGSGASGGTSGSGGARSGGTNASGGSGSGGTSASGGSGSGGTSASGGAASGGTNASGGARSGGASGSGGAASGGTSAAGGARSGGSSGSGGVASGGRSGSGGVASGGTTAAGGAPGGGGTTSGGTGGTGGAATSSALASGGSATTGGTSAGSGTGAGATGGNSGTTSASENSGSGCDIAGVDRRATRWGAMLAFGAVVAEKLRRLVSGNDRSS